MRSQKNGENKKRFCLVILHAWHCFTACHWNHPLASTLDSTPNLPGHDCSRIFGSLFLSEKGISSLGPEPGGDQRRRENQRLYRRRRIFRHLHGHQAEAGWNCFQVCDIIQKDYLLL